MKAIEIDYSKTLRISNSPKHGKGVYAKGLIPKGAKVIEYVGKLVSNKDSDKISEREKKRAEKNGGGYVYLFTLNKRFDIDGNVPYNKARLINHSCDPNCEVHLIKGRLWIFSKRRIAADEELTYDYGFDMDYWRDHICLCRTAKCQGYIVSASRRGALAKVLKAERKKLNRR